ncbi:MAG: hypothetical protein AABX11_03040 [Nanoarchaeota archaeon]
MNKGSVKKRGLDNFTTIHVIEKKLKHHILEWIATALSITGAVMNAKILFDGFDNSFYIWTVANFLWIGFALKYKHYGLVLMNVVYAVINILAILKINGVY